jgi:hypothetical protein
MGPNCHDVPQAAIRATVQNMNCRPQQTFLPGSKADAGSASMIAHSPMLHDANRLSLLKTPKAKEILEFLRRSEF